MTEKPGRRVIIGWKIDVMVDQPGMGWVRDYSIEYSNSPVRDLKSRTEKIQELMREGREYVLEPIWNREKTEDEITKTRTRKAA